MICFHNNLRSELHAPTRNVTLHPAKGEMSKITLGSVQPVFLHHERVPVLTVLDARSLSHLFWVNTLLAIGSPVTGGFFGCWQQMLNTVCSDCSDESDPLDGWDLKTRLEYFPLFSFSFLKSYFLSQKFTASISSDPNSPVNEVFKKHVTVWRVLKQAAASNRQGRL